MRLELVLEIGQKRAVLAEGVEAVGVMAMQQLQQLKLVIPPGFISDIDDDANRFARGRRQRLIERVFRPPFALAFAQLNGER